MFRETQFFLRKSSFVIVYEQRQIVCSGLMLVFCHRINGLLRTKVIDSGYMCKWTSEHPHSA